MKLTSGPDAMSMKPTAQMTAMYMMLKCCTMPTEVMTESREKMASRMTIWVMTCQKAAWCSAFFVGSKIWPSSLSCISMVPFRSRKMPPTIRMMSRQEKLWPKKAKRGSVRVTTQATAARSPRRVRRARPRPTKKACLRCEWGRVVERMEMKTMLSMPRTISISMSVPRPAQAEGSATQAKSKMGIACPCGYDRRLCPILCLCPSCA